MSRFEIGKIGVRFFAAEPGKTILPPVFRNRYGNPSGMLC